MRRISREQDVHRGPHAALGDDPALAPARGSRLFIVTGDFGTLTAVVVRAEGAVWVMPDLRAEIAYRGLTTAGELTHASFKGLVEA